MKEDIGRIFASAWPFSHFSMGPAPMRVRVWTTIAVTTHERFQKSEVDKFE